MNLHLMNLTLPSLMTKTRRSKKIKSEAEVIETINHLITLQMKKEKIQRETLVRNKRKWRLPEEGIGSDRKMRKKRKMEGCRVEGIGLIEMEKIKPQSGEGTEIQLKAGEVSKRRSTTKLEKVSMNEVMGDIEDIEGGIEAEVATITIVAIADITPGILRRMTMNIKNKKEVEDINKDNGAAEIISKIGKKETITDMKVVIIIRTTIGHKGTKISSIGSRHDHQPVSASLHHLRHPNLLNPNLNISLKPSLKSNFNQWALNPSTRIYLRPRNYPPRVENAGHR